ncbi:MAG: hypothetical protein AAFU79_30760 [Myxococcota bacterium]
MVAYAGFFDDVGKAKAIHQTLKDKNYGEEEVLLIEPKTGDDLKKAISYAKNRDYISKATAEKAMAGLEKGKSFLVVKARLGDGLQVEKLFADGGEMLSTSSESMNHFFFSDLIGMPLLADSRVSSSGAPAAYRPFTERFGMMIVEKRGSQESSFGLPLSMKSPTMDMMPTSMKPLTTGFLPLLFGQKTKK